MSPANVSNFVHDLVEMAKAMETLPMVQAELERVNNMNIAQANVIQSRELRIIDLNTQIDALNAKVREAEQGRDAAETMFLECDDKLSGLRRIIEDFQSHFGVFLQASAPPTPVPSPVAIPVEEPLPGVSVPVDPTASDILTSSPALASSTTSAPEMTSAGLELAQGQSEADPTGSYVPVTIGTSGNVPSQPVVSSNTASSDSSRFHGLLYMNTTGWRSREDWLSGGGTEATFDWREGMRLPDGFYYTDHGIEYKS